MCNHKDFVGIGKKFRKKELHSCLRDKFIVAAGDSILRGPLLRMLSPFLSLEEMKYWPSHSFGAIKGNGLLVYWDYLAKGFLRPHEKRDEKLPKDVLRHLVDNHIHPTVWKDKEALFLIGGTSSYLHEFHGWIESCEEENFFGCPWKKKQGGKGASAVIKGPGVSKFWLENSESFQKKITQNSAQKREALDTNYGFVDVTNITGSMWSTLVPGDADQCACHFCVYDYSAGAGGDWRERVNGAVCTTIANHLAHEICEGKRKPFI